MEQSLNGKRIVVIGGAGEANGGAISRALADGGARVAVADLDLARAEATSKELNGGSVAVQIDVRDNASVDAAIASAAEGLDGLDGLVTVVGGHTLFAPWQRLHDTSLELWDLVMQVNLGYVVVAVQAAVRRFLEQGTGGSIVSVGSISGHRSSPGAAAYGAAKAGLDNLAKSVALEYARDGVRMNVVACGVIATEAARIVYSERPELADRLPMGRTGDPTEVAALAAFLASPAASYVSGQSIEVDGALLARFPLPVPDMPVHAAG